MLYLQENMYIKNEENVISVANIKHLLHTPAFSWYDTILINFLCKSSFSALKKSTVTLSSP